MRGEDATNKQVSYLLASRCIDANLLQSQMFAGIILHAVVQNTRSGRSKHHEFVLICCWHS